jgi:hypothetical protein
MSRGNTPPPPAPSYAEWVAKYRADKQRERELHIAALERRRAAGLLTIDEPRYSAENAEADAAEWAIDNDEPNGGDEGRWLGGEL